MIIPFKRTGAVILALVATLFVACKSSPYRPPESAVLGHMSPIETALREKKWVPWGLTEGALKPGDILRAVDSFRRMWDGPSCVEKGHKLPLEEPGQGVTIETVSVSADQLSGGIGYLGLAQADLAGMHVSIAKIQFTDLAPKQILIGPLNEILSTKCSATLNESGVVHVSEVLYGRLDIKFYTHDSAGALINITSALFNVVGGRIEGLTLSQDGQKIVSTIRPLGFRDKEHSAEDVLSWIGVTSQGAVEAEVKRSFTAAIRSDLEAEKIRPKLIKDLNDDHHSFALETVEIWLGEHNFSISRFNGISLYRDLRPLYLTGYSTASSSRDRMFEKTGENPLGREVVVKEVKGYEPFKVVSVPVGREFYLTELGWHRDAYCQQDRTFDFFILANITRFKKLGGVNVVFIIAKDLVETMQPNPIHLVDVKLNSSTGMFEPHRASDFPVEDLGTHGSKHGEFFLKPAIAALSRTYPEASQILNELSLDKVSIYQTKFQPSHPYAIALRCPRAAK